MPARCYFCNREYFRCIGPGVYADCDSRIGRSTVTGGFGSDFDTETYYWHPRVEIGGSMLSRRICDDCIRVSLEQGDLLERPYL